MKAIINENNFVKAFSNVIANEANRDDIVEIVSGDYDPEDTIEDGCLRYHCTNEGVVTLRDSGEMEASDERKENKLDRLEALSDRAIKLNYLIAFSGMPAGKVTKFTARLSNVEGKINTLLGI